jgi:hypothetical protein
MNPQLLAISFVIGSVILMRAIRLIADLLYPSRKPPCILKSAAPSVHKGSRAATPGNNVASHRIFLRTCPAAEAQRTPRREWCLLSFGFAHSRSVRRRSACATSSAASSLTLCAVTHDRELAHVAELLPTSPHSDARPVPRWIVIDEAHYSLGHLILPERVDIELAATDGPTFSRSVFRRSIHDRHALHKAEEIRAIATSSNAENSSLRRLVKQSAIDAAAAVARRSASVCYAFTIEGAPS